MNVTWVWSLDCDTCEKFAKSGVVERVSNTIIPLPDVHWMQRKVSLVGSTNPRDNSPAPPLTTGDDGSLQSLVLFESPIGDLEEKTDNELYTPCMILEAGDTVEQVDVADYVGQTESDVLSDSPWSAARSLMKKTFRFYLDNSVDTSPSNKIRLRQEQRKGGAQTLEPQYEYGVFKPHEWQDAFTRARQVNY